MMTKEKTLSNDIFKDRKEMWDTEKEMICNLKHHIKLAQMDIEDALDKNVMGMVDRKQIPTHFEQNNEAKEIIDKIFLKHFGAKLLEDDFIERVTKGSKLKGVQKFVKKAREKFDILSTDKEEKK